MSLSKIPLIIIFSIAFKRCYTPPNAPPPPSETFSGTLNAPWYTQKVLPQATNVQILAGLAEMATIMAWQYPHYPISKFLLSALIFTGGNTANMRISPLSFLGCTMMVIGTLIRMATFSYLGKLFRFEASIQKDHHLVTGGPYSLVRHPSYTGLIITSTGWFLWQFGQGSWVRESGVWNYLSGKLIISSYAVVVILGTLHLTLGRMAAEDDALHQRFGEQWEKWAGEVKYMVIPGVY